MNFFIENSNLLITKLSSLQTFFVLDYTRGDKLEQSGEQKENKKNKKTFSSLIFNSKFGWLSFCFLTPFFLLCSGSEKNDTI